jgi:hypothetical protein
MASAVALRSCLEKLVARVRVNPQLAIGQQKAYLFIGDVERKPDAPRAVRGHISGLDETAQRKAAKSLDRAIHALNRSEVDCRLEKTSFLRRTRKQGLIWHTARERHGRGGVGLALRSPSEHLRREHKTKQDVNVP